MTKTFGVVARPKPPKDHVGVWVNVYKFGRRYHAGGAYRKRARADAIAKVHRHDCVFVHIKEATMMYIKVVPDDEPNAEGVEITLQDDNVDVVRARFMPWEQMCEALASYVPRGHHIVKFGRRE